MKKIINKKVLTPDGIGIISGIDLPTSNISRIIVKLKKNPYEFNNVCYFRKEIKLIKNKKIK